MRTLSIILGCLFFVVLTSCQADKTEQPAAQAEPAKYKVAILYPTGPDTAFNMDYYEKNHMPLVAGYIGKNLEHYEIDKGISGRTPADTIPFVAIGYFYIRDVAAYNKSIGQNIDTILADIRKYTAIKPIIQISEIKQISAAQPK